MSVRKLAKFVGKTTATVKALPTVPLHYRALKRLMRSVSPKVSQSVCHHSEMTAKFSMQVQLLPNARANLTWWVELTLEKMGTAIIPPTPTLVLESDVSNMGWGATIGQERTGRLWSLQEAVHHINYLKLLAMLPALKTFVKDQSHCAILCKSDNVTVATYLNQKKGAYSEPLCNLALEIWDCCLTRRITATAEHLLGSNNLTADQES